MTVGFANISSTSLDLHLEEDTGRVKRAKILNVPTVLESDKIELRTEEDYTDFVPAQTLKHK